jgi:hypothetical protein
LQLLSERSTAAEHKEDEGDMIAACELADDLRDAIVEYQVGTDIEKRTPDGPLMQLIVLATEGDLQAKL